MLLLVAAVTTAQATKSTKPPEQAKCIRFCKKLGLERFGRKM